MMHGNSNK